MAGAAGIWGGCGSCRNWLSASSSSSSTWWSSFSSAQTSFSSSYVHFVMLQRSISTAGLDLFIDPVIDRIILYHCPWWNNFALEAGISWNFSWTCSFQFLKPVYLHRLSITQVLHHTSVTSVRQTNIATIAPFSFLCAATSETCAFGKQAVQMNGSTGVLGFEGTFSRDCMLLCKNLSNIEHLWLKHYWHSH